ncbi:probable aminotransferase TAT2 isoform X2 [Magnolia sinica]|uniref:probable aminotransferase TAT2 isoform X2 n=1 Tax=Magnolia sinica TaxID=86752 RepID=UPI00265A6C7E|nr:probable aminotransferase TAT2 isoform X2 [Magnolia sinica]
MKNGRVGEKGWNFEANDVLANAAKVTIRGTLETIMSNIDCGETRSTISLCLGDPSVYPCFHTTPIAEDAVVSALRSSQYNGYAPVGGVLSARRAIAEYLSHDLPYKLSPDDVFVTVGCGQSTHIALSVLARPGANILLPRPGYSYYEARAAFSGVEVRHFNLIPERNWEVDLDVVESLADEKTIAMVLINPGNPCGNVFTYQHLAKVAETAKKLGILIIADEVYGYLTFGSNPFVPMGVFGSVVPVLTLGSISKRWIVPGWRCGWLVTSDPNGILKETKGAIPQILGSTGEDFFNKTIDILRQAADICVERIKEIDCITCPCKPEGSMSFMVKLDVSRLVDILDDVDFCCKLAKEESVLIIPGSSVRFKNWLRITFAVEPSSLEDGLQRLKSFCQRHAKK